MTYEYTKIQLTRQDALTRLIQDRLASAGEKLAGGNHGAGEGLADSPSSKSAEVDWSDGGIQTIQ